jgi:hypothetical protein
MSQGISYRKLGLLSESIHVAKNLQQTQLHPFAYLLENVPPLGIFSQFFWLVGNILKLGLGS